MTTSQPRMTEPGLLAPSAIRPQPRPARYGPSWSVAFFCADLAVVSVAASIAQAFTHISLLSLLASDEAAQATMFATTLWLLLFERIGMYRRTFSSHARDEVYASLAASAMSMAPTLLIFLILPALHAYRPLLVMALALSAAGVSTTRFAAHILRSQIFRPTARRIAIVGAPDRVAAIPDDLSLTSADEVFRFAVEDFDAELATVVADGDVMALDWLRGAFERNCLELIVTEALPPELMPALLRATEARGVKLAFAPMRIRPHACDFTVRRDGGLALLYPRSLAICTPGANRVRRIFDLAIAVPAVLVLAPLFGLIALAVAADSGRPIFYRQTRVGRHGREFSIVKFRTMRTDAEIASGPVWARTGEDRTTRVGRILRRSSLDELPQLFNVIRGDMSIVGPRPERPFYVEQFRKMLPRYDERHLVKPGITGWSHVHMRRNVDTSAIGERLSYDLFYLEHWSIFVDILIICKTGAEVFFHSAA